MEEPVPDPVAAAAARRPDRAALITAEGVLSWADVDARVSAAAAGVIARTEPGDRVAIVLGNTVDFVAAYFGTLRAGRVAVPLNPGYTADELDFAFTDSGAALIVAEQPSTAALPLWEARRVHLDAFDAEAAAESLPPVNRRDLAVLLYTSGTSGRPKGAMLTHAALAANHDQLEAIEPPPAGPDDVVLLAMPFFHAYGLNTGLGAVAHHAATGVLLDRFDPSQSLALIASQGVTVTIGVPQMYAAWAAQPEVRSSLAGLRTAVCGAAPLPPSDAARFTGATGKNILIGYGLTETAPVLTTTAVSDRSKTGSIGRPLPGVSLRLRAADGTVLWEDGTASPDEDLAELDLSVADSAGTDPGEIVVRGPNLFSGYWPDGRDGPDAEGWWPTGDVAYADGDGDLHLVDRLGELILVNGFNVYPAEIERVLVDHPSVAEAAVIGVDDPDSGQKPYAYVVAKAGPAPSASDLRAFCAARLARFKLPAVEFVGELPHSAIGKVRKRELR